MQFLLLTELTIKRRERECLALLVLHDAAVRRHKRECAGYQQGRPSTHNNNTRLLRCLKPPAAGPRKPLEHEHIGRLAKDGAIISILRPCLLNKLKHRATASQEDIPHTDALFIHKHVFFTCVVATQCEGCVVLRCCLGHCCTAPPTYQHCANTVAGDQWHLALTRWRIISQLIGSQIPALFFVSQYAAAFLPLFSTHSSSFASRHLPHRLTTVIYLLVLLMDEMNGLEKWYKVGIASPTTPAASPTRGVL